MSLMAASELIDIIVPVYNGASYIRAFAEMMKPQQVPGVGFLFVDDGSTDETAAILDCLVKEEALNMTVIHQNNGGVSSARNAGIDASDAKYLAFCDIDDIVSKDYIKELLRCTEETFDVTVFNIKLLYTSEDKLPEPFYCELSDIDKDEILTRILFDSVRFGGVYSILVRREHLNEKKIRFAYGYPYYEDSAFTYKTLAMADKIKLLEKQLYGYVARHEGSAMARFNSERLRCLELYRELEGVFEKNAPGFSPLFKKYGVSRIYWSVLWQAALASPDRKSFIRYAKATDAKRYMKLLKGFPERKVKLLRSLYLISVNLYYLVVNMLGRGYTNVGKTSAEAWEEICGNAT